MEMRGGYLRSIGIAMRCSCQVESRQNHYLSGTILHGNFLKNESTSAQVKDKFFNPVK